MSTNRFEEKNDMLYIYYDDFLVIKPKQHIPTLPVACPLCDFILTDTSDDISFKAHGCCLDCTHRWVQPDRKKWASGWRPNNKQVKKQQKERHSLPISFYLENI
mgnify:CR=1 FL=1|tara:strand:+ start:325 stop:636 length:312 start_codon:yes stop_codon:yes gene_type:complete